MKRIKHVLCLLLCVCMAAMLAACSGGGDEAETNAEGVRTEVSRIAILLPGYITDQSWNQGAYEGLKSLEEQGYEIAYTEDVQAADMESTFRSYCSEGYDFVIGHGVQYGDACVRVAQDYPDVYFFITGNPPSGDNLPGNIAFYDYKEYEGAFVCGALAALQSESGIIGYIGGGDNSTQASDKNAFIEGAQYVNPDIDVRTVITGTFNDSSIGRETALAMIEQGVDVILQTCDETGLGAFEACEEQGVYCIGYTSDQSALVEGDLCLTSLLVKVPEMITSQIDIIATGEFGGLENPGLKEGVIALAPFSAAVSEEVQNQVNEIAQQIMDGEITITPNYNSQG